MVIFAVVEGSTSSRGSSSLRNPVIRRKFLEGLETNSAKNKIKKASNSRLVVQFLQLQFC